VQLPSNVQVQESGGQLQPMKEAGSANADQAVDQVRSPVQPEWWPLPTDQAEHVSQLLDYWQNSSDHIRQCTCEFTRWDYDPAYCNYRDPQTQALAAFAVWRGELRFASPDKAVFETTELWKFKLDGDKPDMEKNIDENLKLKWVCDGECIYDYNFVTKVLTDIRIPEEFRGEGLVNSPLPFLFGANRETLLNRFWIRPITPPEAKEEYWLQVIPKRLEDARTYSRVEIIIARQDFLPKSMIIFSANYDPKTEPVSQAYVFENRKINGQLAALQDFLRVFVKPKLPMGWSRVEQKVFTDDGVTAQKEEIERAKR
jgi:TIGR03009 family protein